MADHVYRVIDAYVARLLEEHEAPHVSWRWRGEDHYQCIQHVISYELTRTVESDCLMNVRYSMATRLPSAVTIRLKINLCVEVTGFVSTFSGSYLHSQANT